MAGVGGGGAAGAAGANCGACLQAHMGGACEMLACEFLSMPAKCDSDTTCFFERDCYVGKVVDIVDCMLGCEANLMPKPDEPYRQRIFCAACSCKTECKDMVEVLEAGLVMCPAGP